MIDENLFGQDEKQQESINFATIDKIFSDGVTLRFDGENTPTQKHYKVNTSVIFEEGNRVRIIKDSGTYVVEYPVGSPNIKPDVEEIEDITVRNINITGTLQHEGDKIGFYGSSPKTKADNIGTVNADASLQKLIDNWNRLIKAFDSANDRGIGIIN